jgi:anthraniloyl-CoA monooxygenase
MKAVVVGGGPAGLYFALLAKKANPSDQVTVIERNPPDATFGWGVVFSEETLGALRDADFETYDEITNSFARWNAIDIYYRNSRIRSRGHVFTGISRKVLLNILQRRARQLGVELVFGSEIADLAGLREADLLVGADGINGRVRQAYAEVFRPSQTVHPTKYVWFGTNLALDAFTFIFRRNHDGLFQVHAYPFDARTSTFIVECAEETWRRAGLDQATERDSIAYCEELFGEELNSRRLLSNRSVWVNFITLRAETWHTENVVLLGDAAHTAHFSIGSGTKLAMEDAIALVDALRRHGQLEAALTDYEMERQPVVERFQAAALESSRYFEDVSRYERFDPQPFAFNLLTRSGRISYVNLTLRDPAFVRGVDAWYAGAATGSANGAGRLAPPPMFAPLQLGEVRLANRVAAAVTGEDTAKDGCPGDGHLRQLLAAADTGAAVALTELTGVSPDGRVTSGSTGLYSAEHAEAWGRIVAAVHERAGARIALSLGHAGRRGSMRPRQEGIDRPLRQGGWPVRSASAIAYTPHGRVPRAMDAAEMRKVIRQFAEAAERARHCGFDLLELNLAHGYLLASFLSPLSNQRTDDYGGSLANRMRFPLAVVDAVQAVWTGPLAVKLSASDWMPAGFSLDDAVTVAAALKQHGCHLIHAVMGQNVAESRPDYGRMFGVPAADRIRNEAEIATLAAGNITTTDEVNTILAAGRADLCLLDQFPSP